MIYYQPAFECSRCQTLGASASGWDQQLVGRHDFIKVEIAMISGSSFVKLVNRSCVAACLFRLCQ
jgi:hypothetical protein